MACTTRCAATGAACLAFLVLAAMTASAQSFQQPAAQVSEAAATLSLAITPSSSDRYIQFHAETASYYTPGKGFPVAVPVRNTLVQGAEAVHILAGDDAMIAVATTDSVVI
jgi:hypothetical protein